MPRPTLIVEESIQHPTNVLYFEYLSMDRSTKELGFPEYWSKRYGSNLGGGELSHEWFRTFNKLRQFLERELPNPPLKPRILIWAVEIVSEDR